MRGLGESMTDIKKIALVTGASGVLGSAIAKKIAFEGIDVALHYHQNEKGVKETEKACRAAGVNTWVVQADFEIMDEIEGMFQTLNDWKVYPNILINNAGLSHYGLIQEVKYLDFLKLIHTHLTGTFFISQKLIPEMLRLKYGRIVNISSVWGDVGAANEVLYSMVKGALNTFTKALAKELAPSGITVNTVAPGIFLSEMMKDFTKEELEELKNEIPMNRFADPEEIAQTVLYFLDDRASYITGQMMKVDGGWK